MKHIKQLNLGHWVFLGGILLAMIISVFEPPIRWFAWVLILAGLVVGIFAWIYLNTKKTLIGALVFVLLGQFAPNALIEANMMLTFLYKLTIVFVPVAVLMTIRLVVKD